MDVINGIAYAEGKKPVLSVRSVHALEDYKLEVRFNNDEVRIFDFKPLLEYPCYKPLKDKKVFESVYVDYGIPVWNEGDIDIAPETLYENGKL